MKKMLVLGMTLVVLLVGIAIANANVKAADTTPDDHALLDWYVKYEYGSEYSAAMLSDCDYAASLESEYGGDYVKYIAVDQTGEVRRSGVVRKSYMLSCYKRNN